MDGSDMDGLDCTKGSNESVVDMMDVLVQSPSPPDGESNSANMYTQYTIYLHP